eukprot:Plantae.Rhodophyta-Purpureofilum_apyrenoidigerum.ctg13082.p1 GENE.Plantae.Rhodophyta-Purpureofilum_apyrenoidigerum.ctg13082~~Plantae.Rhodophyta-Purpureofilum_apyrenoidigerum.ctg13082.p1  ORF type:complete len:201 (+),score=36.77 Plantae.Rhodophyta-Purpureofilum_apyrenoidigerum.ctg13082:192-794(+)
MEGVRKRMRGRMLQQLLRPLTGFRNEKVRYGADIALTTGELPRKIIFLDIDGVLHAYNCAGALFNSMQLGVLKEIVDTTGAEIVLTSNWRRTRAGIKEVEYHLRAFEMKIYSKTIDLHRNSAKARAEEIYMWLKQHPEVDSWVVLDDLNLLKHCNDQHSRVLCKNFVRTNPLIGLTRDDIRSCLQILGVVQIPACVVVTE